MKVTLESTQAVVQVQLRHDGPSMPARVWEGTTEDGTPCFAFIVRIAPAIPEPLPAAIAEEFGRQLQECRQPTVPGIPLRLII